MRVVRLWYKLMIVNKVATKRRAAAIGLGVHKTALTLLLGSNPEGQPTVLASIQQAGRQDFFAKIKIRENTRKFATA